MTAQCAQRQFFSFGAGVQSTAILLLIKHNPELLINKIGYLPEKAFFADTGAEPQNVYSHLKLMMSISSIPIEVVSNGSLLSNETQNGIIPRSFVPYFTKNKDGTKGMLKRKCTSEFKILPIHKALRKEVGLQPKQRSRKNSVGLWLGISTDEIQRMKTSQDRMTENIYPLIEIGFNRTDCFNYCKSFNITPPKSRCFFCPYISDWVEIKRNQPEEFERAVIFDRKIRQTVRRGNKEGDVYIHPSLKPLDQVVQNQGHLWERSPWETGLDGECTGMCGT